MPELPDDVSAEQVEKLQQAYRRLSAEIGKAIVGQQEVVGQILMALVCRGHALLEGVPGLGKTLLIRTLGRVLDLSFSRIQFTPDLMPSDITGTEIIDEDPESGRRRFRFVRGPIFAHLVLADEINRTPPKTQSALLQAMQEYEITSGGETYPIEKPFFVLATQNPIEHEGTYPLPEAQLDRFMFHIEIGYPRREEEVRIVTTTTSDTEAEPAKVLSREDLLAIQHVVRRVPVAPSIVELAVDIVRASRPQLGDAPGFIQNWLSWGAGPRATQYMVLAAKARALLGGRFTVANEDVLAVAPPVLRHRVVPSFTAEAEGMSVNAIIGKLLEAKRPR